MSGHPFNGIITSLFIRARPGRYITSVCSGPAFCDKRPLLGIRWRRGCRGLTCARWYQLTVCRWLSPKAWSARLNSLLPESGEHQECCTLVSRVTPTPSHGAPAMRKWAREGMKGKERERKGIYYSARPRPLHTRAIKNRKSIAETNGF